MAVLVLALGQASTEVSKGSRTLFEELAKIELVNGRFRVALKNASPNVSALRQRALALFPSASRIRVQSQNGSTSTSRGGTGGEVWIRIGHDGGPSSLHYQVTSPPTGETIVITQQANGDLKLQIDRRGLALSVEQTGAKCVVRVRGRGKRVNATGKTLAEVFQLHPIDAREEVVAAIERYLGKPPLLPLAGAPPGKTIIRLRDGAVVVGDVDLDSIAIVTTYGRLTIPRAELYHVFFPGAADTTFDDAPSETSAEGESSEASDGKAVVVTPRFTPRGTIDLETIEVRTPYGRLVLSAEDILHIAFGAVDPTPSKGGEDPGGEALEKKKAAASESSPTDVDAAAAVDVDA
ncbi:MAG TPA: hypothetical protein VK116_12695 [Planctomycetota bacterium]|nr:hypothetical protein [Planctomycetota bacterium]